MIHVFFYRKSPLLIVPVYVVDGIILSASTDLTDKLIENMEESSGVHNVESNVYLGL